MERVRIGRLTMRSRADVARHLQLLDRNDRHLRFLAPVSDEILARYVEGLAFERDLCAGAWHGAELVGFVHLALCPADRGSTGELGISVDATHRRAGLGRRLIAYTLDGASDLGVARVEVNYAGHNFAMDRLARAFNGRIEYCGTDRTAVIGLQAPGRASAARANCRESTKCRTPVTGPSGPDAPRCNIRLSAA